MLVEPVADFLPWIKAGFTTRNGGVSQGTYTSLNVAYHVGDDTSAVRANRDLAFGSVHIDVSSMICPQQVHSGDVAVVSYGDRGRGAFGHNDAIPDVDALVTCSSDVCLAVMVADCVPLILIDQKSRAIAAIHAGRVGSSLGIGPRTLATMNEKFATQIGDVLAIIDPCIDGSNYEIAPDKADDLRLRLGSSVAGLTRKPGGGWHSTYASFTKALS